jgi:hypothetical protein
MRYLFYGFFPGLLILSCRVRLGSDCFLYYYIFSVVLSVLSGCILFPLSGHVLLLLGRFSGHSLHRLSRYVLYRLIRCSGYVLFPLDLLDNLIEPLPDHLEVIGVLPAAPYDSYDPKGKQLSPRCLLFLFGKASLFPISASLLYTFIYPAVRVCAFVREKEQLVQVEANSGATNYSGEIRGIPDNPVREYVFDLLPVGMCLLLVGKLWNSGRLVTVLKNCGNHKKTSSDQTSRNLTLARVLRYPLTWGWRLAVLVPW